MRFTSIGLLSILASSSAFAVAVKEPISMSVGVWGCPAFVCSQGSAGTCAA